MKLFKNCAALFAVFLIVGENACGEQHAVEGEPIISSVTIVRQNVFDLSDDKENYTLYRWANQLHIMTRESVIENQLLFAEGDVFDKQRLEESERILRQNSYLYDASISSTPREDGAIDIVVTTRDVWTLTPEIDISRSGGENRTKFGLEEDNLLGTGQRVSVSRSDDVDRVSKTFEYSGRQIGARRFSFTLRAADNSDGHSRLLSIVRPFYSLDARWTAGGFIYDDERRSTLYDLGNAVAEFQHERENHSLFAGWSRGLHNGWVKRWTLGVAYDDNRFSAPPAPTLPVAIPTDRKLVYPYVGFEVLENQFEKSANSDQIERSEDFYFGKRVGALLGWSDESIGADRDALVYSLTVSNGLGSMNARALLLTADLRGRHEDGSAANTTLRLNARYYSRQSDKRVFFATLDATAADNLDLDNPLEIGGDTGLRGYPLRYQSGKGRVLVTVEQRFFTDWYPWRLFRVGGAVFADAGRVYGDNPLGGDNLGWLTDVGFGFRFAPTRLGTRKMLHLDIAFPLDGDPSIDSVQVLLEIKRSF